MSDQATLRTAVTLDRSDFEKGLDAARRTAENWADFVESKLKQSLINPLAALGATALAAFSVGSFAAGIKGALTAGDAIYKLSQKYGIAADKASILKEMADRQGKSMEEAVKIAQAGGAKLDELFAGANSKNNPHMQQRADAIGVSASRIHDVAVQFEEAKKNFESSALGTLTQILEPLLAAARVLSKPEFIQMGINTGKALNSAAEVLVGAALDLPKAGTAIGLSATIGLLQAVQLMGKALTVTLSAISGGVNADFASSAVAFGAKLGQVAIGFGEMLFGAIVKAASMGSAYLKAMTERVTQMPHNDQAIMDVNKAIMGAERGRSRDHGDPQEVKKWDSMIAELTAKRTQMEALARADRGQTLSQRANEIMKGGGGLGLGDDFIEKGKKDINQSGVEFVSAITDALSKSGGNISAMIVNLQGKRDEIVGQLGKSGKGKIAETNYDPERAKKSIEYMEGVLDKANHPFGHMAPITGMQSVINNSNPLTLGERRAMENDAVANGATRSASTSSAMHAIRSGDAARKKQIAHDKALQDAKEKAGLDVAANTKKLNENFEKAWLK